MKKFIALLLVFIITFSFQINIYAENSPKVNALGAVLMDFETGRILWGKNENEPLAMASTTKIMTAILAIESGKLDETLTVSKRAQSAPEVKLHILEGEQYTLKDMLYAMMLSSYNDTAVAIAEFIGGSVEDFCTMMTEKAKSLGCTDTVFKTPNGLDLDDHHSTAKDMAIITAYALKNDTFREIIKTPFYTVNGTKTHTVTNKDRLLTEYEGAIGVKTGFTGKAGHCFVGAAQRNGQTLISVVLGSGWGDTGKEQKWIDTKNILNYGFENFSDTEIVVEGDFTGNIPVTTSKKQFVSTEMCDSVTLPLSEEEKQNIKINIVLPDSLEAPVLENTIIGKAEIFINDIKECEVNIKTSESAERNDIKVSSKKIFNIWNESGNVLFENILKKFEIL